MKALRLVLLAIACVAVFGITLRLLHPGWAPPQPFSRPTPAPQAPRSQPAPTAAEARTEILSRLADAPAYAPFFDKLRAVFPGDYTALVDEASDALLKGGHRPNPDRLLTEAMRHLRQTRGILASKAEAGPLSSIFAAQATVLDLLAAENAGLCADFLYGGSSPEFMAFAATHRDAVERLALASLDAIVSGQANHIEHQEPTPDDLNSLATALKARGLSEDQIAAVLDGKTFDPPLPATQLCDAGRTYLHAVQDMPDDERVRVYALSAALLARS